MKSQISASLLASLVLCGSVANAQMAMPKISQITIVHVGPRAASDSLIRANIRTREGEVFARPSIDEDVKSLYATGFFANVKVAEETTPDGTVLKFILQGKPILTDIKIIGNKKYSAKKLLKKVTSKVGQPLDERKLFTDAQEIQKFYEKAGYQKTTVKVSSVPDDVTGRGTATIEIHEAPKIKIKDIVFDDVTGFKQKKLRGELKTKRRWMFSFLTGSGILKEDEFEDDKDRLVEFLQNEGFIDASIKDVKFDYVTPKKMVIHLVVSQGRQYKVGSLDFKGNNLYTTNDFLNGVKMDGQLFKVKMVPGKTFTPVGLTKDTEVLKDFYGAKGYINSTVFPTKVPNPTSGTMDLVYDIEEKDKSYIEKIEIKGNSKTKDRVIRRELSVAPGEVYDMVRVKLSKTRIEQLDYFEKVDTQPEVTDVPDRKNLVLGVEEKNTGNVVVGAGFSSIDSVIGFVELTQGNFDLFKPPTFTGAGQKFRIRAQIGSTQQDYEIGFIEPWFLGRKLALGVDLFYRELDYLSLNNVYNQTEAGGTVSLTRALGSDFLIGKVSYTLEQVDIGINSGFYPDNQILTTTNNVVTTVVDGNSSVNETNAAVHHILVAPATVSQEIFSEAGTRLVSKVGLSLAYDTRNNNRLPNSGQRSEISTEVAGAGGDTYFYKLELKSAWYFKGFAEGHIFEVAGRAGVSDSYGSSPNVPIFDRWFLGGLTSLRGYKFREIGPQDRFGEPLGGDTYFFGYGEYSVPIIERVRFAMFYDIGNVFKDSYSFDPGQTAFGQARKLYSDDWGFGIRLNLPIGPLRLDYGIPITHDPNVGGSGRFQFGAGWERQF